MLSLLPPPFFLEKNASRRLVLVQSRPVAIFKSKVINRTRVIITLSCFETTFNYKPRILDLKMEDFLCLLHKLSLTLGLLICTWISENQGLEKSRSASNLRNFLGPAILGFFLGHQL